MIDFESIILKKTIEAIQVLYSTDIDSASVQIQETRKEFEGDFTLVVFPFLKISKKNPEITGSEIGDYLVHHCEIIEKYNIIKGFLNLTVKQENWLNFIESIALIENFGIKAPKTS